MTELNVKYAATTTKPEPSGLGRLIHSYIDLTPHQGEEVHDRYIRAATDAERDLILCDMPRATVTFHELEEGEPFFAEDNRPRDSNGWALWDSVWVVNPPNFGSIEAAYGDEYDVQVGDDLIRMKLGEFKHLCEMTSEDDAVLEQMAAQERATRTSITA